jgi:peptidoglycan biosynthesis protein MviN/MurJ (putative lipid II flippase)
VAWRRYRDRKSPPATLSRGRWLAGIAATALFVFAAVALYGVTDRWLYDRPPGFESLFVLPVVTTVLAAASAGLVSRAWRRREWGRGSRVHLTLVVAGVATLCGLCWHWNLMWPVA